MAEKIAAENFVLYLLAPEVEGDVQIPGSLVSEDLSRELINSGSLFGAEDFAWG